MHASVACTEPLLEVSGREAAAEVEVQTARMMQAQAFRMQQEIQLRFLCPSDVGEVKKLCSEWFPIE